MRADPRKRFLPAEAKEEEQRQTGLVRAHAARQGEMRGIARAGHIARRGHGQAASGPPWPAPHLFTRRRAPARVARPPPRASA